MATVREVRTERVDWRPRIGSTYEVSGTDRGVQIVSYLLTVVETLLLFRFVMRLFGANSGNAFVSFIYDLTSPLVAPFRGIFASPASNGAVIETASVLAMIAYAVIAYLVVRFFMAATGEEKVEYRETDLR